MNTATVKLTKTIYDLAGNGLEINVEWDPEYNVVENVLSAYAVIRGKEKRIDQTDILLEHGDLRKMADNIDWRQEYAKSKDDSFFNLGRDAMKQAAQQTHY